MRRNGDESLPTKRRVDLEPHDCVELGLPGGAGYGSPLLRDPAAVKDDVAAGYISLQAARKHYGVAIVYNGPPDALVRLPESFEVLVEQTAELRRSGGDHLTLGDHAGGRAAAT